VTRVQELEDYFENLGGRSVFAPRPQNIPGDRRLAWRTGAVCVVLSRGRSKTLALDHLSVLWWAMLSPATRELLSRWFAGQARPDELLVRYDPSLSVTLDLAQGAGLISVSDGKARLLAPGIVLAEHIWSDESVMSEEKAFLRSIPAGITQTRMRQLLEWR